MKVALAVLVVLIAAGCGGTADRSSSIAAQIGPNAACTQSGYGLIDKASGKKTPIYDCSNNGKAMCVTDSNGIISDQTAIVKLLFASSLSGKPGCLGG